MRATGYHAVVQSEATATATPLGSLRFELRLALGLLLAMQLLAVNYWPRFPSPNERPRAYQALAAVHRGSLAIGPELTRWGGSEDVAAHAGHLYPNKAPGMLPLLLPGAAVAHLLAPCGSEAELAWALVLGRLLASTVPTWVALWLLWRRPGPGPLLAGIWALATPALAASLLLFSHALTACLLLAALALLERGRRRCDAGAGAVLGWACACEYPLAVPAAVLVLAATGGPRWRRWLAVGAGAGVPATLLAIYNSACFGSVWSLSSAHEAHRGFAALEGSGVFGVGLPDWQGVWGLVLSPERGLVIWVPLVLVAALGLARLPIATWRTVAPAGLAFLSLLVLMSGYRNWHGGWFPGPRYLLAALPLLLVALAPALESLHRHGSARVTVGAAVAWGIAASWLSVASFPFSPEDLPMPFLSLSPALLAEGIAFPSRGGAAVWIPVLGLAAAVAAWALVRSVTRGAGELVGALGLGVAALLTAHAATPTATSWRSRLEVAVIRDLYGDGQPRGALARLRRDCLTPQQCAQVDRWSRELRPGASPDL